MKIKKRLLGGAAILASLATSAHATVIFTETFEDYTHPVVLGTGIPSGTAHFDNFGWSVNNPNGNEGVVLLESGAPNAPILASSNTLAFGLGQDAGMNFVMYTVSGFGDSLRGLLCFEAFVFPDTGLSSGQQLWVQVLDGADMNVVLADGDLAESPGAYKFALEFDVPDSGEVVVKIAQNGSSHNSDTAIDNVTVTAVPIPEPSILGLGVLSLLSFLRRRRS